MADLFDRPAPTAIIAEVASALEKGLNQGFPQLVAANALGIAARELDLGPALAAAERQRLAGLLGHGGELADLRQQLAAAIKAGKFAGNAALADHLARTAIAKMQIDQPRYAAFRAWQKSAHSSQPQGKE